MSAAVSGGARGPRPSALLFDFGGTLDAEGVPWKERFFRIWSDEAGVVPRDSFDAAFHAADDALVGAVPVSWTLAPTLDLLSRGVASRLATGEGAPAVRVGERFARETLETLAGRAALLTRLSAAYRLAIVSNFYGNLAAICEEAGIDRHFSAVIDSAAAGCSKPDARIFEAALAAVGAGPGEAVLIGDSVLRDMQGARDVGMRHVLLRPRGSALVPCCEVDRVIGRLDDLAEVFL